MWPSGHTLCDSLLRYCDKSRGALIATTTRYFDEMWMATMDVQYGLRDVQEYASMIVTTVAYTLNNILKAFEIKENYARDNHMFSCATIRNTPQRNK